MFDIQEINDAIDSIEVAIPDPDGELHPVEFHYRRPDHLDVIEIEYETSDLDEKVGEYRRDLVEWLEEFEEREGVSAQEVFESDDLDVADYDFSGRPELKVPASELEPRIEFCREFVTDVDGVQSGGESVEWSELDDEQQLRILRLGGADVVWRLFDELKASVSLSEDTKND